MTRNDPPDHLSDEEVAEREAYVAKLLAGVRDGSWLDGQTFPPVRYAVPGLIPEGFSILIGPPKAGKSWLILSMLLSLSSGGRALGQIPVDSKRRVLYLALEDGDRRMQDRCRQLLGPNEPIPEAFTYTTRVVPGKAGATIKAYLERYPDTGLVVIDTLGKVMPPAAPGESAYQRDYRVGGGLKEIADSHPGLALVVLHHDRKAMSDDFVDSVSGTHGLAGAADTIVVLARKRQSTDGLLKVTGRDIPEGEYAITLVNGTAWTLDGGSLEEAAQRAKEREEGGDLGDRSNEILAHVRAHPTGVTARNVEERFGDGTRRYLARLVDAGRLVRAARGVYRSPDSVSSVPTSQAQVRGSENRDTGINTVPTDSQDRPALGQWDAWDSGIPAEPQDVEW